MLMMCMKCYDDPLRLMCHCGTYSSPHELQVVVSVSLRDVRFYFVSDPLKQSV